jgi:exopolysaccharide production protein ExoY
MSLLAENTLVLLLARTVQPKHRLVLNGGSGFDAAYTLLNQLVAAVLIVLLAPVLATIIWRIRKVDGSPVTYAHGRIGQGGKVFHCFKFRSMVRNSDAVLQDLLAKDPAAKAEWERDHKLRDDPRITLIGEFLRKTSLDELPQLFNVLRGDMHFVGPRPVTLAELARYGDHKLHYLAVKPGLTGLWQVSGRNDTSYEERVQLDARYVERRNPVYDLVIALRTVKVLITREGAI